MNKLIYTFFMVVCFVTSTNAQDKIFKKNGDIIEGHIKEVGVNLIIYHLNNLENGFDIEVKKQQISRIELASGATIWLEDSPNSENESSFKVRRKKYYGRNLVNIVPVKLFDAESGYGFSYERILGKNKKIGIVIPVSILSPDYYGSDYVKSGSTKSSFNFMPGLKFYPFGQQHLSYAMGPSILIGFKKHTVINREYDPKYDDYREMPSKNFRIGIMVNNYLNYQITSNIQTGLNVGLGRVYMNKETFNPNNIQDDGNVAFIEIAFNLGFRF
jgi:hypothetical protein